MSNLGENLKKIRKLRRMTQSELAEKAGYQSRTAISRIEHGEWEPTPAKIRKLAEVLDVSPGDLLQTDKGAFEADEMNDLRQEAYDDFHTLFSLSRKATPEQLQNTIEYLRFLTKDNDEYDGVDAVPGEENDVTDKE